MGLWQPENAYAYDRAGLAQGHLTVTAIQERRFSLNLRAGIYIRHGRSDWYRICDFGCSDDRYTIGGWLLGLYPTFPLNPRWSLDAAVELRADKAPFGFTGLGVKRRLWVR